jgi:hypothetical protein
MFVRAAALRVPLEEPQDRKAGPALRGSVRTRAKEFHKAQVAEALSVS